MKKRRQTTLGTPEPEVDPIAVVLGEHLGVEPDAILGYVIGVEHADADDLKFSSVWSARTPSWRTIGFGRELVRQLIERFHGTPAS